MTMTDRRQRYIVVLTLLVGFILGFLYTSSYSRFMVSRKPAESNSQINVIDKKTLNEDIRLQFNTNNKIELTFPNSVPKEKTSGSSGEQKISIPAASNGPLLAKPEFWGTIISRNDSGWYKQERLCDPSAKFVRTNLRGPQHTPIHVYTQEEDQWVSGNIIRQGMWEGNLVRRIHDILKNDPDVVFLDIGANVGVFSLTVAKLGRYTISVDALEGNVARLCRSMRDGNLSDHMIVIHNALSYQREKVALGTHKRNVGGTYVKKMEKLGLDKLDQQSLVVEAVLLDDLLEIFNFKKVVIKMDVETFEANVLKGGEKFFSTVQVEYLLLEFVAHRGKESGNFIVDFLKRHNLVSEISNPNHSTWTGEVMFKRVSSNS